MSTTYDIAQRAGLNQSTVSRALAGSPLVNPDTVRRVRQIGRELGYVANVQARALKTRRTQALAVHLPQASGTVLADPFVPAFLCGISGEAARHGYSVILSHLAAGPRRRADLPAMVTSRRADGVILASPRRDDPRLEALVRQGIPVVAGRVEGPWSGRVGCVDIDNRRSGRLAARHFLRQGVRRLGLVVEEEACQVGGDFRAGFCEALAAAGVSPEPGWIRHVPVSFEAAFQAASGLLAGPAVPEAIIADTALTVFGVLEAVRQSGRPTAVLGVGSPLLRALHPELAYIRAPVVELGRQMVRALLVQLRDGSVPAPRLLHTAIVAGA